MMPLLDRTHRVIAVDMLGFGGSEKPGSGYSIEDQAIVIAQALVRLGVRHATVVGHSLGGTVATALAERASALVDRLAIVDQTPPRTRSTTPVRRSPPTPRSRARERSSSRGPGTRRTSRSPRKRRRWCSDLQSPSPRA
jgi:pimeloyl-ACP methyl ester carboxylesterase